MPKHKRTNIPQETWDFFEREDGLSTDQLIQAIDKGEAIDPFLYELIFSYGDSYRMIHQCRGGYDLVRYYRDNSPKLSVDELLQYGGYTIRDFVAHDIGFKFHNWILKYNLKMLLNLISDSCDIISTLCNESGMEYLNRKILVLPEQERQTKLSELIKDRNKLERDIELELAEVLVAPHEVIGPTIWPTINDRFVKYKENELKKEVALAKEFTKNGIHSLFWLSAKKVAKLSLETSGLSKCVEEAVTAAKTLKFL